MIRGIKIFNTWITVAWITEKNGNWYQCYGLMIETTTGLVPNEYIIIEHNTHKQV